MTIQDLIGIKKKRKWKYDLNILIVTKPQEEHIKTFICPHMYQIQKFICK